MPRPKKEVIASPTFDKAEGISALVAKLNSQFGPGTVMQLNKQSQQFVEVISTGDIAIDSALGVGGLPKGRIIEIYGGESSGKTTLTLSVIAQAQKNKGTCAFIDVEHALDPAYAKRLGVNIEELLISQPDCGEDALSIAETLIKSNAVDVIVVDSVAALVTKQELNGEMGDATVGSQARLMSQAMRRLTAVISNSNCLCIFINQIREKVGVMYGNPETTPGGRALKFFASIRIELRKKDMLKTPEGRVYGNQVHMKVVKNKVAPPFTEADFEILYDEGISQYGSLIQVATEFKVIEKKGAWFSFEGKLIGQGNQQVRDNFKQDETLYNKVLALTIEKLKENGRWAKAAPVQEEIPEMQDEIDTVASVSTESQAPQQTQVPVVTTNTQPIATQNPVGGFVQLGKSLSKVEH